MFVSGNPFNSSLMYASKAGAYPSEAPFMYAILGRLLGLPTNIRVDWKGLQ